MKQWDGTSPTRRDLTREKAPDYYDYQQIVSEIQGIQEFVTNLAQNAEFMPNLEAELLSARRMIADVKRAISEITPPKDVIDQIKALKAEIGEVDVRGAVQSLDGCYQSLQRSVLSLEGRFEILEKQVAVELRKTQNQLRNDFDRYKSETEKRLASQDVVIRELQALINIRTQLERIGK